MGQQPKFERKVPTNSAELYESLLKLHKNHKHIKSYKVNPNNNHVEVDLSTTANTFGGTPDFYFPLKKGSVAEAQSLLDHIFSASANGSPPSETDARKLFDLIDPQGR